MATVTGIFISEGTSCPKIMSIEDTLTNWYSLLECQYIDIPTLNIEGLTVDVIADDEGLLTGRMPTCFNTDRQPLFVGSLFLCSHDSEGELISLTPDAIRYILEKHIGYYVHEVEGKLKKQVCIM